MSNVNYYDEKEMVQGEVDYTDVLAAVGASLTFTVDQAKERATDMVDSVHRIRGKVPLVEDEETITGDIAIDVRNGDYEGAKRKLETHPNVSDAVLQRLAKRLLNKFPPTKDDYSFLKYLIAENDLTLSPANLETLERRLKTFSTIVVVNDHLKGELDMENRAEGLLFDDSAWEETGLGVSPYAAFEYTKEVAAQVAAQGQPIELPASSRSLVLKAQREQIRQQDSASREKRDEPAQTERSRTTTRARSTQGGRVR